MLRSPKTTVKEICVKTFAYSHCGIRSIEKTEAMTYDDGLDSKTYYEGLQISNY